MSHVTDTILLARSDSLLNGDRLTALGLSVNAWLHKATGQELVPLNAHKDAYGGSKVFQCDILTGAIDYLPLEAFTDFLRGLDWKDAGSGEIATVQLIAESEHDAGFRLIPISGIARDHEGNPPEPPSDFGPPQ